MTILEEMIEDLMDFELKTPCCLYLDKSKKFSDYALEEDDGGDSVKTLDEVDLTGKDIEYYVNMPLLDIYKVWYKDNVEDDVVKATINALIARCGGVIENLAYVLEVDVETIKKALDKDDDCLTKVCRLSCQYFGLAINDFFSYYPIYKALIH